MVSSAEEERESLFDSKTGAKHHRFYSRATPEADGTHSMGNKRRGVPDGATEMSLEEAQTPSAKATC